MAECRLEIIESGAQLIPRSCPRCGFGPCERQTHLLKGTRGLYIGAMEKNRAGGLETREHVANEFEKMGITLWNHYKNPIMSLSDEGDEELFKRMCKLRDESKFDEVRELGKSIRTNDLSLIDKCDFVICELDTEKLSCGTWEELFLANRHKKPIFVYSPQGKTAIPLWMWWTLPTKYFYNNLNEIIGTIEKIDKGIVEIDSERWKLLKPEYR